MVGSPAIPTAVVFALQNLASKVGQQMEDTKLHKVEVEQTEFQKS